MAGNTGSLLHIYILLLTIRVESTTLQLDEVQVSQEEELAQLERSATRMRELEKELAEEKQVKVRLTQVKTRQEEELRALKEKLDK